MARRQLVLAITAALTVATAFLGGCAQSVGGRAVSIYDDPFTVAGLPSTNGPSGPRPGAPDSTLTAEGSDGGDIDRLMLNAVDDIQAYWNTEYRNDFDGSFAPVEKLVSWNAKDPNSTGTFCGEGTYKLVNAEFCRTDNSIGWDRGVLMPVLEQRFGKISLVQVLAHEYGHAIQTMAKLVTNQDPQIVKEQQADCFAGAFMRHVAEGRARHFVVNTSDGLNNVLAATVAIRDADPTGPKSVHGSAFERVTVVQIGFTDGPKGCAAINQQEIQQRRQNLPTTFANDPNHGQSQINQQTLNQVQSAMTQIMPLSAEPKFDYHSAKLDCSDATSTAPVSYCPATNTIGVDVAALAQRGAADAEEQDLPKQVNGDYNAYIVFISRYALAVQHDRGMDLSGAKTGLRAACLSGVITKALGSGTFDITLSPDDLDKAVSGLLTDGLAASDALGRTVPSGFARIDAFRAGVLADDQNTCNARYQ